MQRLRIGVIVASILTAVMGGCPASDSGLPADSPFPTAVTGDTTVGRPTVDPSATDPALAPGDGVIDAFNARLATEFPTCSEPSDAAAWRTRIIELVNQARVENGLGTVVRNDTLQDQATQYACEMISEDFFAHVNPVTQSTLSIRSEEFGYDFQVVGENLAAGQRTPEQAFADWMNSPSHRQNILDPRFTQLGVGVRTGGEYGFYWVQEFGLPAQP